MSNIQGVGQEFLDKIISGGLIVMGVIFLIVVILGIGLYIRWLRQFNVRVEIKSLRGSGTMGEPIYKIVNDVGGFVENKTDKTRWFRLRNQKVDLPSPPLEALELDSTGRNHLKIFQKSDTEYYYLLPDRIDMKVIMRGGKEVPIAEMLKYAPDLISMTGGRGNFTMEFSHYDEVPAHLLDKIVADAKKEKEES